MLDSTFLPLMRHRGQSAPAENDTVHASECTLYMYTLRLEIPIGCFTRVQVNIERQFVDFLICIILGKNLSFTLVYKRSRVIIGQR